MQLHTLQAAGGERIFTDKASGGQRVLPPLPAALDHMIHCVTCAPWRRTPVVHCLRDACAAAGLAAQRGSALIGWYLEKQRERARLVWHDYDPTTVLPDYQGYYRRDCDRWRVLPW